MDVIVAHRFDSKSATKTAMRDGDWSDEEYVEAYILNELRMLRADQAALLGNEKMTPNLLDSPRTRAEKDVIRAKSSAWNDRIKAGMRQATENRLRGEGN